MSRRGSQSSRGVSRNRRNVFSRAFMKTAQGFDFRKEACKVGVGKAVKVEVEREGKKYLDSLMDDILKSIFQGDTRLFLFAMRKLHDWDPNHETLSKYLSSSTVILVKALVGIVANYGNKDFDMSEFITDIIANAFIEVVLSYGAEQYGMALGQAIIPIPMVGGIIGGMAARFTVKIAVKYIINLIKELRSETE